MKTAKDPRHKKRIALMQALFTWQFSNSHDSLRAKNAPKNIAPVVSNISEIDKLISLSAPGRPLDQINKIDLAILRLSVFELIIEKETPPKVVIDEAVELGKEFGSDSSSSFINGVLGKVVLVKEIKTNANSK